MKNIVLYSPICLEKWDFRTMDKSGIGGSETAHSIMAYQLSKNPNLSVTSIAPCERDELGPGNVPWLTIDKYKEVLERPEPQIWIVGRSPDFFDNDLPKNKKFYFLAQDVDYDWTEERLAKVDKYICLCQTHARWTLSKYPSLQGRVYVSTNGIDSVKLRGKLQQDIKRIPKRIIYSSSPDRGLEFILENWFRVVERHPDAKLEVFYGFDNLLKIAQSNNDQKRFNLYNKIITLAAKYPESVTLNGRIPQNQLYNEMLKSSIWFYPSDWPETSCQLAGSLCYTHGGMKPIEEISEGDLVLTHKGRFKKVTKTIKKFYQGKIYSIKRLGDFKSITVTEEHPIWTGTFNNRSDSKNGKIYNLSNKKTFWSLPSNLKEKNNYLFSPRISEGSKKFIYLNNYMNDYKFSEDENSLLSSNHQNQNYKKIPNYQELTEEFMYVLGVFAADGSCTPVKDKYFSCISSAHHSKDRHIAERFAKFFDGKLIEISENQINTVSYCSVWARFLNNLIGVGRNKKIPSFIFDCSYQLQKAFLDGYIQSDGHKTLKSGGHERFKLDTISANLAYGTAQLLNNQEIFASILYVENRNCYSLSWREDPKTKFFLNQEEGIYTKIESIKTENYEGFVYNFEVEDDESYVTDRTAVHNCITSMEMQAMGVYPIVNIFWAVGENVLHGIKLPGIPQKDPLCKASIIKELLLFMDIEEQVGPDDEGIKQIREMLSEDALDSFSWEKVSKQYENWFNE